LVLTAVARAKSRFTKVLKITEVHNRTYSGNDGGGSVFGVAGFMAA
jgi:hypothetical protein